METSQVVLTCNRAGIAKRCMTPGVRLVEENGLMSQRERLVQGFLIEVEMKPMNVDPGQPRMSLGKVGIQFNCAPQQPVGCVEIATSFDIVTCLKEIIVGRQITGRLSSRSQRPAGSHSPLDRCSN